MDEVVGRYKVRLDRDALVLTHPTGISFDINPDEAVRLAEYILARKQTLISMDLQKKHIKKLPQNQIKKVNE